MRQSLRWFIALVPLLIVGVSPIARAQTLPLQAQQMALNNALCAQAWGQALQITSELLNTPELQPTTRTQLVQLRPQLVQLRDNKTVFTSVPGCGGSGTSGAGSSRSRVNWERVQEDIKAGKYDPGVNINADPYYNRLNGSGSGYSGSGGGRCDTPGQVDSRGRSCGGRAASERPGGRRR